MENRNVIIALIAVIVVLAVVLGVMFLHPGNAQQPTKLKITSDDKLYKGDELSIQLTDSNKTGLSGEIVNITIANSKGKVVVDDVVKTNSKGKAKLELNLKEGKYQVKVSYGGNENYTGDNDTQKLTVKEKTTKSIEKNSVETNNYPNYSSTIGSYRIVETQQELAVVETPSGEYYVLGGDGFWTYEGHDSQGHIQLGSPIGH